LVEDCNEDVPNKYRQVSIQEAPETAVYYNGVSPATMSNILKMSKEN
jgi:hypothetical protein